MGGTKEVWVAASALSAVLASYGEADAATRSGKAGYVRAGVTALSPGAAPVRINVGDAVFSDQKLVTDDRGRIAVMLLDRSTLTLGPNSEVTIDQYEYDQKQRTGSMAIEAAKGFFRFVGGFVSKRRPVRIRTPSATIGIRGADVTLQLVPNAENPKAGLGRLIFNSGFEATVEHEGGNKETITEPGFMIEFSFDPEGDISKIEASQEAIAGAMNSLYPGKGEKSTSVQKETFIALRERIDAGEEISVEDLESALGFDVSDTIDSVIGRLDELGMEDVGMSGGGGGGGGGGPML